MAKHQSARPGRDVRGGTGKRQRNDYRTGAAKVNKREWGQRDRGGSAPRGGRPQRRTRQAGDVIEGRRAVAEALDAHVPIRRALVAAGGDRALAELVARLEAADVAVEYVPRDRLDSRSAHGAHQGIMLEVEPFAYADLADVIEAAGTGDALVILLDHVTDEGNFGAIVRTAECVGAAGVVVANARAARVGTAAYKTSAGAVLHVPIAQVANLATAIETLKEAGFWVGAASEHAEADIWGSPLEGRICLVMGSEGSGVSQLVLKRCDFTCRLPQRGRVESLNVAQAATAVCYEWLRRTMMTGDGADGSDAR